MSCPACASSDVAKTFRKNELDIFTCRACGHGYLHPIPSNEELKTLYSKKTHPNLENGLARELEALLGDRPENYLKYFGDRLDMLEHIDSLKNRRILDFGCASGLFVQALRYYGASKAEGVDIIKDLVELGASRNLNLTYDSAGTFLDGQPASFDVICANNVLEHLAHPEDFLGQFHRALKPGGFLFISVPSYASIQIKIAKASSPIVDPPHHVHYYTPRSLVGFLERSGFHPREQRTLFWGKETDIYLTSKGVPGWLAPWARHLMFPVKRWLESTGQGGIVQVLSTKAE